MTSTGSRKSWLSRCRITPCLFALLLLSCSNANPIKVNDVGEAMDMISSIELGFAKESQASSLYANDATPALDPLATPTLDPLATPTARGLDPLDFNPVVRHGKKPKKPKKPKKHHPEECECEPEEEEPCDHQCTIIKAKPSCPKPCCPKPSCPPPPPPCCPPPPPPCCPPPPPPCCPPPPPPPVTVVQTVTATRTVHELSAVEWFHTIYCRPCHSCHPCATSGPVDHGACRVVRNGPIQQKGNGLGVSDMELKCALLNEPHTVVWDSRNECAQQAAANDEGAGISAPQPNQPQPNLPQPNQPQSNPPQANGSGCAVSGCAVSGCGREAILPNDVITANVQQDPVAREASGVIEQHAPAPKDIMNVNAQTVPAANDAAIGAAQQAPIPNDASVFPPAKAA